MPYRQIQSRPTPELWLKNGGPPLSPDFSALAYASRTSGTGALATASYTPAVNALLLAVCNFWTSGGATPPSSVTGNGLVWTIVTSQAFGIKGAQLLAVFKAIGAATAGALTITSTNTFAQIRVIQFANVMLATPIAQSGTATATTNLAAKTLAAFNPSGRNAGLFLCSDPLNPFGGPPKTGWSPDVDNGVTNGAAKIGLNISYRENTVDNVMQTAIVSSVNWGVIAVEINAP